MRAVIQEQYGDPEKVLSVKEIPVPVPADDQVLVKVKAASVHADVWHMVTGLPYAVRLFGGGIRKPKRPVPGTDLAGIVEAVGKDVSRFRPGDAVFGESHRGLQIRNGGAYAEYAAVPEDRLVPKPANISFEQAASVPTSGIIAYMNLLAAGEIREGEKILINGAGGGVGMTALQLARARGADVTAVDNGDKQDLLRTLGANTVIDYTRQDILDAGRQYEFILDVASTLPYPECKKILTPVGIYVRIGHVNYCKDEGKVLANFPAFFKLVFRGIFDRNLPKIVFSFPDFLDILEVLREYLETGKLTPVIDSVYSLEELPAAIRHLAEGNPKGKIVLVP